MMEIGHTYRPNWEETLEPGLSFFVRLEEKFQHYTTYIIKAINFSFHIQGFEKVDKLIESELGKIDREFRTDYNYPVVQHMTISIKFQLRTGITNIMKIKYLVNYKFLKGHRQFMLYLRKEEFERIKTIYDLHNAVRHKVPALNPMHNFLKRQN